MSDILPHAYLEDLVGKRVVLRAAVHGPREYSGVLLLYVTDHPDEHKGFQNGLLVIWDDQEFKLKTFDASRTPYVAPISEDDSSPKTKTFPLPGNGKVVFVLGEVGKPKQ